MFIILKSCAKSSALSAKYSSCAESLKLSYDIYRKWKCTYPLFALLSCIQVVQVVDHRHTFVIVIHTFIIITANLNPNKHIVVCGSIE